MGARRQLQLRLRRGVYGIRGPHCACQLVHLVIVLRGFTIQGYF